MNKLNDLKHIVSYPEGALVLTEGQSPRGIYILCHGQCEAYLCQQQRQNLIVRIAQADDIIGVSSVISGELHELTAENTPAEPVSVHFRSDFLNWIGENGDA